MRAPQVETLLVRVHAIERETDRIKVFDLRPCVGHALPEFEAGAHIDIFLLNGLIRSYSLCNSHAERERYVIAVDRAKSSSGGSEYMHGNISIGDELRISHPRNNFPLHRSAQPSVMIAGGIGITPIRSMIQHLVKNKLPWKLYYCARSRGDAAFLSELEQMRNVPNGSIAFNFDGAAGGRLLDIAEVVAVAPADAHLYCCGPQGMLAAFKKATSSLNPERVHLEYFAAADAPFRVGGFTVVLARSGRRIQVMHGKSILQTLLDLDILVPYSCSEGTCGSCETGVLKGTPDHRDAVLSESERARNDSMMICCSGCLGDELVLDL